MIRLEDLTRGAVVRGIVPNGFVTVIDARWHGASAIELTYKDASGRPGNQLLFRDDETRLELVTSGHPWSFDADGELLRLVSEAQRIRLAHLFDPYLAVYTSLIEPLPHQITAVYETMLPRLPLRFLLADDPGAGKTIMGRLCHARAHGAGAHQPGPRRLPDRTGRRARRRYPLGAGLVRTVWL